MSKKLSKERIEKLKKGRKPAVEIIKHEKACITLGTHNVFRIEVRVGENDEGEICVPKYYFASLDGAFSKFLSLQSKNKTFWENNKSESVEDLQNTLVKLGKLINSLGKKMLNEHVVAPHSPSSESGWS
jgi:hypothetical protein